MKKKVLFIFLVGLCISLFFVLRAFRNTSTNPIVDTRNTAYFATAPIVKFSAIQTPCVDVEIGNQHFTAELDLGFRGDMTMKSCSLSQLPEKIFVNNRLMYGWQGKEYLENVYKVPKLKIGGISFSDFQIQEENEAFHNDCVLVKEGHERSPSEAGRLGWELFYNTNLFLNCENSEIAFCDSAETLKEHGISIDTFVKTPLLIERGFVEFEATTSNGPLRCVLDTGATWNIMRQDSKDTESVDQLAWSPNNFSEIESFQIGEKDFGKIGVHNLPIKLPVQVEIIIGMEFLAKHRSFIDFRKRLIYFEQ